MDLHIYKYISWKHEVAPAVKVKSNEDGDFIVEELFINSVNRFSVLEGLGGGRALEQGSGV